MKRFLQLIISAIIIGILCLVVSHWFKSKEDTHTNEKLYVYNWGEYIDPSLIKKFEKETGIQVVYETFDSNEAMGAKIRNGGTHYDVAFPSEYIVQKLKRSNLLIPLNHNKIPNMKNLDSYYTDMPYDPHNQYSVPYFFGTVGILYNKNKYPKESFNSWSDLYQTKFKNDILLVDGAREIIGLGLNKLGYSLNDKDSSHIRRVEKDLKKLTPQVRGVVGDEITMMLQQNEGNIAVIWSGVAAPLVQYSNKYDYVVPKEGSNLWFDNMVIPKTAQNKEGAYKFMNFLLDAKNSKQNTDWVGYATPNKAARDRLPEKVKNDHRFYPTQQEQQHLEVYKDLGQETLSDYNESFLNFKMSLK
ncbi:ABC transporter substrate-binding protein [Staphylococcus saccharolyticus]|uniref:ABC transporter substrate-binding protein n=1 Tax=Staphylococcus saccharolyticus TaxID=33028 RepID=UPI00102DA2D2|nr:spermidine/putrescine ABC transporter substrate-binding protein [Staphylococcus saccharolyticus]MBL7572942.1 spermidine/putrescine ABC transporter substrate-binding protein [Staphylococcus saccharolyticus]MBL7584122.1 spermidine/putrescine ABC transporter substrate-binding protein [Staphylococcus saccharolyticus]QRJ67944.1 spermidine/putrescine ABC transporter substrate-binding protein [Staphylococcus saccharolyticus]TAA93476.1 spermidine/putrescine ABC transporter substrate-binding protein 